MTGLHSPGTKKLNELIRLMACRLQSPRYWAVRDGQVRGVGGLTNWLRCLRSCDSHYQRPSKRRTPRLSSCSKQRSEIRCPKTGREVQCSRTRQSLRLAYERAPAVTGLCIQCAWTESTSGEVDLPESCLLVVEWT